MQTKPRKGEERVEQKTNADVKVKVEVEGGRTMFYPLRLRSDVFPGGGNQCAEGACEFD